MKPPNTSREEGENKFIILFYVVDFFHWFENIKKPHSKKCNFGFDIRDQSSSFIIQSYSFITKVLFKICLKLQSNKYHERRTLIPVVAIFTVKEGLLIQGYFHIIYVLNVNMETMLLDLFFCFYCWIPIGSLVRSLDFRFHLLN